MAPPIYYIKSDGRYQYICTRDDVGSQIYWLKDDYVWSLNGKDKLGFLKYYHDREGNWYSVIVNGSTVGYVQK